MVDRRTSRARMISVTPVFLSARLRNEALASGSNLVLRGTILGLREEEVDKDSLKQVPKDKHKVEVVVDVLESRATAVLDDGRSDRTGEVAYCSTLGSDVGRKTLSNVGRLERGPAKGEDDSEDEYHGDGGIGGIAVVGVFDGEFADQKGSTADNIGETSTENGTEQAQNWVDTVECQDLLLIIDTGLLQHSGEIATDSLPQTVTTDLSKDSHTQNTDKSASGAMGVPKTTVVPPGLVSCIRRDLVGHLLDLENNHGVIRIALSVPSRGLGKPKHGKDHNTRGNHLAPDRNSPSSIVLDVTASVDNPTGNDTADVPSTVVQTSQSASPLGMGHLTDVARSRDTAEADAKAQDEATSEELTAAGGGCLDTGADDDDECAGEHSPASAEPIVDGGSEEDGGDGTDVVHGEDDTGRGALTIPADVSQVQSNDGHTYMLKYLWLRPRRQFLARVMSKLNSYLGVMMLIPMLNGDLFAHALKPNIEVNKVPLAKFLELWVLRPAVGGPPVDRLDDVLEPGFFHYSFVLVGLPKGSTELLGSLDEAGLPLHDWGGLRVEGVVIAEDGDLDVLNLIPTAWAQISAG
ncbi:hypothetical protein HG530_013719 [Fusarium avenaceum]|nr:hypothetical protein HG530_013719 [Fusarium avenaceum]